VETDRLAGNDVHERPALQSREHRFVQRGRALVPAEHGPAARAGQRLVGRGGDPLSVRDGRGMDTGGHQPGDVGHVHHELGPHLVGDGPERAEVDLAR